LIVGIMIERLYCPLPLLSSETLISMDGPGSKGVLIQTSDILGRH